MNRTARIIAAIVVAQAALFCAYFLVERRRAADAIAEPALSTAPPVPVDGRVQPLTLTTRDGERVDLRALDQPALLHFWATWCAPCRAELPGLLALSERDGVTVLAVALDEDWADVDRFLDGRRSSSVLLGDSAEVENAFGVRSLPVSYLVDPGGRLRLRFDGARAWHDASFVRRWIIDM